MDQAVYNYTLESSHAPTLATGNQASSLLAATLPLPVGTSNRTMADQELVGLCAQHIANRKELLECPLDPEESPHWASYTATHDAISIARPTTLAGLAAKARAAKREACVPGYPEDIGSGSAIAWAWDLVNDLIRLDDEKA